MSKTTVHIDTTWEIRHTDPSAPGKVIIRILAPNDVDLTQTLLFTRPLFLEFADQIQQTATAIRAGFI